MDEFRLQPRGVVVAVGRAFSEFLCRCVFFFMVM